MRLLSHSFSSLTVAAALLVATPQAFAQTEGDGQAVQYPAPPGDDYLWVEGCVRPDGEVVEGFWRRNAEAGFVWQDAGFAADGAWVDYDFVPEEAAPDGYSWEPGYRGEDGIWHLGFWRENERPGYKWRSGTYDQGQYNGPDWEPEEIAQDEVYEPGYRAETGYFIPGFRRPVMRGGYTWVPGYWDGMVYVSGYWQPMDVRSDAVYVPGYADPDGYWVDGFWRPNVRVGFSWVDGYYVADTYVYGFWRPMTLRSGYYWEPGYCNGGVWVDGFWRPSVYAGHYWRPGYYYRGVFVAGGWVGGVASLWFGLPSAFHYRYAVRSMLYHGYHVTYGRPHYGPHYRMSASALWNRPSMHAAHYASLNRAAAPRQSRAPYMTRPSSQLQGRQFVQSRPAGRATHDVSYTGAQRPSMRPAGAGARPQHNPAFQRAPSSRQAPMQMRPTPPANARPQPAMSRPTMQPTQPSHMQPTQPTRPTMQPVHTQPMQPTRPQIQPVQPVRPTVQPTSPQVEPSRPAPTSRPQPSIERHHAPSAQGWQHPMTQPSQPSRPSYTPPSQPSRPTFTQPSRPSQPSPSFHPSGRQPSGRGSR